MTAPQHDVSRPAATHSPDPGAGSRLREARIAADLSVEEVAARLHLYPRTIAHIENDDYAHLPAPTFVRGYLRAYARLLELPPGPIVEAFDRHGLEPPALVADIANNNQARSGDFPVRIATYLIVLGLGALVVVWWQNQGADPLTARLAEAPMVGEEPERTRSEDLGAGATPAAPSPEVQRSASADPPAAAAGADPAGPDDDAQRVAMTLNEPPRHPTRTAADQRERPEAGERTHPESDGTAAASPAPGFAPSAAPSGESPVPGSARDDRAHTDGVARTARSDPRSQPATAEAPAAEGNMHAGGDDTLELHFQHDSWVEVYGGDDARLYYDLARTGQTVAVRGDAPFRVLLGYARGVRVEYNGVRFDHTPHIRGDIARFELGQQGGTRPSDGAESAVAQTPPFSAPGR